jgi:hypothetical protein
LRPAQNSGWESLPCRLLRGFKYSLIGYNLRASAKFSDLSLFLFHCVQAQSRYSSQSNPSKGK